MKQINKKRKSLAGLLIFALLFALFAPVGILRAEGGFCLNETKLTLYPGNTFQLEYSGVEETGDEEFGWDSWWGFVNTPSFFSSDQSVAVVDHSGLVRAVGVGTAEISAHYNGQQAVCTVKVRKNSCKLDQQELVLYQGQQADIKLTSGQKAKDYTYYITAADYDTWADDTALSPVSLGKGNFRLNANRTGNYYVDFVIRAKDGKDYSARCAVTVLPCGLTSPYLAVANGEKLPIVLENAEFISCEVEQMDQEGEEGDVLSNKAEVSVSKKGVITAKKTGSIKIFVQYETAYHEFKMETLNVHVTEPSYVPFESYLWVGEQYRPQFEGISPYSAITVACEDEGVVYAKNGEGDNTAYLVPQEAGKTTILVTADGVSFTQEVTIVNPRLSAYNMVLEKGKEKKISVTGTQKDNKITFSSSDKSIASVTKSGKVTAKKSGSAMITVKVDGRKYYCSVTVGTGKGLKAVQKAESVLGAEYSQQKRMQAGYYDCSSLVWRAYNGAGIKLAGAASAPTAAELARKLEAEGKAIAYAYVDAKELKPGDIIFYRGAGNGRYKDIDHVALYYGANYETSWWYGNEIHNSGMVIHASGNVHMRPYEYYRTDSIVMIARPVE
ncbi:MAG: Ig-like domain-containing protein [Lachnospiraceae bacterium]|nr:Ig-like domain-containing protein [Lachnospiraceae bacterium]